MAAASAQQPRRIALFGATGSIGASALDVIARHPDRFRIDTLAAHRKVDALLGLCSRFRPRRVVITDPEAATAMQHGLVQAGFDDIELLVGAAALDQVAASSEVDLVIAAIVGAAGLPSTLAAAEAGKTILLANKEAVVIAGALLFDALARSGGQLIPLDSEHNAIFQCLPADYARNPAAHGIRRVLLTASGGPFRGYDRAGLARVTPAQAVRHPRWQMGPKISVDSATLMNKGLEVIEAHWLFGFAPNQIDVLVHPQSLVHSLVEYADGSLLAQVGPADMRTPIAQALAWPERIESGVAPLDLLSCGPLEFEPPDQALFRCLPLARAALVEGGAAPAVLNAANEVAVAAFLAGRLAFLAIPEVIEYALAGFVQSGPLTLPALLAADADARRLAIDRAKALELDNG
ncbi:MAG: 1-deoxy-D-xylulose-5-phosphate reductoisomerase [Lysobacterales bacterium]